MWPGPEQGDQLGMAGLLRSPPASYAALELRISENSGLCAAGTQGLEGFVQVIREIEVSMPFCMGCKSKNVWPKHRRKH